jgi:hypothetical protein
VSKDPERIPDARTPRQARLIANHAPAKHARPLDGMPRTVQTLTLRLPTRPERSDAYVGRECKVSRSSKDWMAPAYFAAVQNPFRSLRCARSNTPASETLRGARRGLSERRPRRDSHSRSATRRRRLPRGWRSAPCEGTTSSTTAVRARTFGPHSRPTCAPRGPAAVARFATGLISFQLRNLGWHIHRRELRNVRVHQRG